MDRSPWGSFWFEPVGVHTTAGLRVTADASMQLSAVFACVRIIAQQFASLPFCLYRNRPDGGKDIVTDHPVYSLIARRPNPYQNGFEWREMMAGHLALRGNAYNQIVSDARGNIVALIPLHPDRVKILLQPGGNWSYQYSDLQGNQVMFSRGEIWHLRGLSADGIIGLSPIALARESVGGAIAAQNYGARFFANDATPAGGWVEYPGTFKDKMAREQFRESVQEAQAGVNRGKIAVFEYGMKYHQISVTPDDAQFLETRKWQVNDIARWFGVPPHKIGDLSAATNNNIEQQAQEFVQETLGPMAERWEAAIEADLLFDDDGLEAEFLFSQLLRGDSVARATYYQMGIMAGWLTRNEARTREHLNPLPGLDAPLMALNMGPVGSDGSHPTPAPGSDGTQKQHARLGAVLSANIARLARRFAKSGVSDDDAEMVAESLAVGMNASRAWCANFPPGLREPEIIASLLSLATSRED
ncbi:MAG: phage portal protein [Betaproteobacteria bacterium]|nr:phage portal protein [Betaproteobacteria bacterium]